MERQSERGRNQAPRKSSFTQRELLKDGIKPPSKQVLLKNYQQRQKKNDLLFYQTIGELEKTFEAQGTAIPCKLVKAVTNDTLGGARIQANCDVASSRLFKDLAAKYLSLQQQHVKDDLKIRI